MRKSRIHPGLWPLVILLMIALVLVVPGAATAKGKKGGKMKPAVLSGTVANAWTGCGIAGATVTVGAHVLITNASGKYQIRLPAGDYPVTFEAAYYMPMSDLVSVPARGKVRLDAALEPVGPVVVDLSLEGEATPGGALTATADIVVLDGSKLRDINWLQLGGAPIVIDTFAFPPKKGGKKDKDDDSDGKHGCRDASTTALATLTLADEGGYKAALFHALAEPPVSAEDLPSNVPLPEGEFPGGLQNRFEVVGLNPFVLEETALASFIVEVTTSSGVYMAGEEIHTHLPWKPAAGLHNVPTGVPVLLHGKDQASYDWALTTVPGGSTAFLMDDMGQNPEFTPDVPGPYGIEVTDQATGLPVSLSVWAGTWRGIIVGQDGDGRPVSDPACTGCHSGAFASDEFTPWAQTGHAEIFSANLDTSTHYGPNCFSCHTVGYDPELPNGGFDDAPDYQAFLDAGLLNVPGDNWTTMLGAFTDAAKLANIQCENCHGPQVTAVHGAGEPRVSISSDVCATCHGEPLRHARFQQWQLSGHADYELAIDEGGSGNCARCHTGNGFLTWLPILLGDEPGDPTASISVDWTSDEVHPQTCATCHGPHNIGTSSGAGTNATVRISGDTPPLIAGFTATDVGRGAVCMTCHNSRRGLRNDATFPTFFGTSEAARAPHGSAQTDVLMGENAYLVPVGTRGSHSDPVEVTDTCVTCHMEATPPPDVLSYNQGGTNHTFFARNDICGECHPFATGEGLQNAVHADLEEIQGLLEEALLDLIAAQTDLGYTVDLDGEVQITDAADIQEIVFGEARGRQAITVVFMDDSTFGPYRMNDIGVLNGAVVLGELYDFADPSLIKAGWNWTLIHNDGSYGVHNPIFTSQVLGAARGAL